MKDKLNIATCYNDTIRIYAANTTNTIKHVESIFNMWPTSLAAVGRTMTIALIMSYMEKMDSKITIRVDGDGPIGSIIVVTNKGKVKGFCHNPGVYLSNNKGKLLVGQGVGSGFISVIKDYGLKETFTSTCEIQTGEIAEDFAYYFSQSEQTNTAVALGVLFDTESKAKTAGGYLIQVMPNCKEETLIHLEEKLQNIKPISTLLNEGLTNIDIISLLSDGNYKLLDELPLEYSCECNEDKFLAGIKALGQDEIKAMIDSNEDISITCNFCNKKYNFTPDDLKKLID